MTSNSRSRPATRSGVPTIMRWARVGKYSSRVRPFNSNRPEPGTMRTRATASLRRPEPLDVVPTATCYSFSCFARDRRVRRVLVVVSASGAAAAFAEDFFAVERVDAVFAEGAFAEVVARPRAAVVLVAGREASERLFGAAFFFFLAGARSGAGLGSGRPLHGGTAPVASVSGFCAACGCSGPG